MWVVLPGTGHGLLRGSLHVDRTGEYGGDLIVVTTGGEVWRVQSNRVATMLVPTEVTVLVNQRTADSLGWMNSYQGLIVPSLASAFGVFLVRQVFMQLPNELREAAALDGVGHTRFLWEVAAPLSRPTLGALALFTFLGTWNAYLWPSQVIRGDLAHETVQIGLERLRNNDIDKVNLVTGGLVIAALPIFIMLVTFQRQLVRGLTAGAVKG